MLNSLEDIDDSKSLSHDPNFFGQSSNSLPRITSSI
jgi:hypothetical protein